MDDDEALLSGLAGDLDGTFEALVMAHQDRCYSIALRMLGDPGDAEEAAQDALVRAYRALAGYDATRILELRLRPWLATIVLNLCRTRLARRAARRAPAPLARRRPRSGDPGRARLDRSIRVPGGRRRPTGRARALGARSSRPCPRPIGPPSCSATSTACRYPDLAHALGRPEGTVKAQVHRGLAMLRTALEAANRLEREEMTA